MISLLFVNPLEIILPIDVENFFKIPMFKRSVKNEVVEPKKAVV